MRPASLERFLNIMILLLVIAQPIVAMDQEGTSTDAWSLAKKHQVMIASVLGASILGIGWIVTKPARDRRYQEQLVQTLQTSTDKEQLANALKRVKNRMPLVLRCNQAAEKGETSVVKLCFEAGVKPTDLYKSSQHDTSVTSMPLWSALCSGKIDVVALCIARGVTPFTDIGGKPALLRVFELSTISTTQKMSTIATFLEHAQDDITPLFEDSRFEWRYGQADFVAKCMPLLAKTGQAKAIDWLLKQRGIAVSASDQEGFKAVHRAAQAGKTEVLKVLVAHDRSLASQIGPNHVTPIMLAAAGGHIEAIEFLWKDGYHPGAVDWSHMTPLAHAAAQGQEQAVKALVSLMRTQSPSCSLDGPFSNKATPLHHALYDEHFGCASYLVEQSADVTREDEQICLPLHIAASKGGSSLLQLYLMLDLVEKSCEKGVLNKENGNGAKPLDLALVSGSDDIWRILQEAGAESSVELRKSTTNGNARAEK